MKCPSVILLLFVFFSQCIVCSWQVQLRCPVIRLNNGKVRVRGRGRIIRFNCDDNFTLVGNKYATCIRGQWDTPIPACVNAECPSPPTPDHAFIASKLNGAILLYFCEPGYSLIGTAEIYCNGRQWNGTTPYCRDTKAAPLTKCDFENPDLCWWEQDPQHDFDWKRHNFETPSLHIGTGPTHDHTFGPGNDGHYLYIEASGRLVNDTARIVSPLYNSSLTDSGCFSFWYHMYGATIGSLNIYFKQETDAPLLKFTKSGNQGNQWFHGIFDLPKTNISFQIIIEGVRGSSYVSDIAIDDVAILQGNECTKNETTSVTVNFDDQIEIVNAQQTCRDRCGEATVVSDVPFFGPENCHCTLDCVERSICCPDFAQYCILGYTGYVTETVTFDGNETVVTYPGVIPAGGSAPGVNGATWTAKSPSKNDSAIGRDPTMRNVTPIGFSINPKDNIDPGMSNSSSTTTRKPIVITTTPIKRTTKKMLRTTESIARTQLTETRETPFVPKTLTTKYMGSEDRSELHDVNQNPEKVKQSGGFEMTEIVIAVSATLAVLVLAIAIASIVIKRRRSYKRGASNSALSEDSDVRFLTSDEILDFNLARPTDNDEL